MISRRNFLKSAMMASVALPYEKMLGHVPGIQIVDMPNIIILVFDAWSARNVSLYGYGRDTMPNLARFAEKAIVYHNHYTAGTFTVPGTASLLTGTYPWTHRAMQLGGRVNSEYETQNIFSIAKPWYTTLGYAQNPYADQLLYQAEKFLDDHVRTGKFNIQNKLFYNYFEKDARMAFAAIEQNIVDPEKGQYAASLFLSSLYEYWTAREQRYLLQEYRDQYARGIPTAAEMFLFDDLVDGTIDVLRKFTAPGFLYLHFYPPHEPYCPKVSFYKKFKKDGWLPPVKPRHPISLEKYDIESMVAFRAHYDEYLASWDDDFGRVYNHLETSGLLQNSYIVITSDHGEMFERGEIGHFSPLIYEPLINIPLIILRPGQNERMDIHTNTSSIDILPTIRHIVYGSVQGYSEGLLLPGLGGEENRTRSIFSMDAKTNSSFKSLSRFSVSLTREKYRLTYYHYPDYEAFEFFDLDRDPEEMLDLYSKSPRVAINMREELLEKIADVNRPYDR